MKDIIPAKKHSPILGLTGMGGGVGSNLGGSAAKKVYAEEVFSNWAYRGDNTAGQLEANGIDLAGEGGLVWIKDRDAANNHVLFDTERLPTQMLRLGGTTAGNETVAAGFWGAASNGFTHGNWDGIGQVKDYASWTFRNQDGFFKVVKWTGNGVSGRQIAHGLGSTPGFVMTKALDNSDAWRTLHSYDFSKMLYISSDAGAQGSASAFNGAVCDATHLTVTNDGAINANGQEYIAYVFAGGPSSAATARSVDFDASGDYLTTNTSSDYTLGTGDFTLEYWYKPGINVGTQFIIDAAGGGEVWGTYCNAAGQHKYRVGGNDRIVTASEEASLAGVWTHIAVVRISGVTRMYKNGTKVGSNYTDSTNYSFTSLEIGRRASTSSLYYEGKISNLRLVVGTGLYTGSFRVPYKPLTNVTNTKLLCCNNSSVTGTTVGTLTSSGDPTASTESPFLDPDGYKFGDDGDQNLIKCGSYFGNTGTAPNVDCGWEPQFIMIKCTSQGTTNWSMYDCIRGIATGADESYLYPNLTSVEYTADRLELTPTGFKVVTGGGILTNVNAGNYVYIAIRRPDGLVQKPIEDPTKVFAMDLGNNDAEQAFTSGFPVDFATYRLKASTSNWRSGVRLVRQGYMELNEYTAQQNSSYQVWDDMTGFAQNNFYSSSTQAWMWRRHAGFDVVVTQPGTGSGQNIRHSLGKVPEMIWTKKTNNSNWPSNAAEGYVLNNWMVWHKDYPANGEDAAGYLNKDTLGGLAVVNTSQGGATDVSVAFHSNVTYSGDTNIMFFFASVEGVCKVGSYTGSTYNVTVSDVGFSPRFLFVKNVTTGGSSAVSQWNQVDTLRGFSAGNDSRLRLNDNSTPNNYNYAYPTSSGFVVTENDWKQDGATYIYYAHA